MLKQPASFGPFVREPIIFRGITRHAGKNKVRTVISAASANRYDVVKSNSLTHLEAAIIAFILLPLVHVCELVSRDFRGILEFNAPVVFTNPAPLSIWVWVAPIIFFYTLVMFSLVTFANADRPASFAFAIPFFRTLVEIKVFFNRFPNIASTTFPFTVFNFERLSNVDGFTRIPGLSKAAGLFPVVFTRLFQFGMVFSPRPGITSKPECFSIFRQSQMAARARAIFSRVFAVVIDSKSITTLFTNQVDHKAPIKNACPVMPEKLPRQPKPTWQARININALCSIVKRLVELSRHFNYSAVMG